jgi:hypothetical protein
MHLQVLGSQQDPFSTAQVWIWTGYACELSPTKAKPHASATANLIKLT